MHGRNGIISPTGEADCLQEETLQDDHASQHVKNTTEPSYLKANQRRIFHGKDIGCEV